MLLSWCWLKFSHKRTKGIEKAKCWSLLNLGVVMIGVDYIPSLLLCICENFHNQKFFFKSFSRRGKYVRFCYCLCRKTDQIAMVMSFALMTRTKSLSCGATKEQLFSCVLTLLSYQRRERMEERCYEVFVYIQRKSDCTRHQGGGPQ